MRGGMFVCFVSARTKLSSISVRTGTRKMRVPTLPVLFLTQPGPALRIFIVKFVVVVILLGTSKGLSPLVALSDVMMIYRHSLGRTGILLPGSLKKLCTGSLRFCQTGTGCEMGGKDGNRAGGFGGDPLSPPAPRGSPHSLQPPR